MLPAHLLNKLLVLLPITNPYKGVPVNNEQNNGDYTYNDPNAEWGAVNSQCNGNRQSGIALSTLTSIVSPVLPPLKFGNYDVPLVQPLVIRNDGKTVNINVGETQNGRSPYITGGLLKNNRYEAVNVHFHWGDGSRKGSEHAVDGRRYDVEMHIVHKNSRYPTVAEAIRYKDGLAVLGIFLKVADNPDRVYPGLEKIFDKLDEVIVKGTETTLDGSLTMGQLLGDLDYRKFFTYAGSLTTPPCSQAVQWQVFPQPLVISRTNLNKFFSLTNGDEPLVNNFRPLQPRNERAVYYRYSSGKFG